MTFVEKAFGMTTRFQHESSCGTLETSSTALAFATHAISAANLSGGYVHADSSPLPLGVEIALVTESVATTNERAVTVGAVALTAPSEKLSGKTVSDVMCTDDTLVELCSLMPA